MDSALIKKSVAGLRKNARIALKEHGVERDASMLQWPPEGSNLFEGIDATPSEVAVYLDHQYYHGRQLLAAMTRTASVGFAVEFGMHDINSEMWSAVSGIKSALEKPETAAARLPSALAGLDRLHRSLSLFSTFRNDSQRFGVTGKDILDTIRDVYGRYFEREKITLETTDAFLAASLPVRVRDVMPPMLNLIRNSLYWISKSERPKHIRLDAEIVPKRVRDWDIEDHEAFKIEDTVAISIADSGPGITPEKSPTVFAPFVSGRGSSGIGLYLTKKHLEQSYYTAVLAAEKSDLGGARFIVGQRAALDPVPSEDYDERLALAAAGQGLIEMLEDGLADDVLREHGEVYGQLMKTALRVRLEGPSDSVDDDLIEVARAMEIAIDAVRRPSCRP